MEIYNDTYCVYIHTNKINGKMYVGQTVHGDNPNKRWGRDGTGYKNSTRFWSAICHYGWNNFEHEIIASNLTLEEANQFEEMLIKELDTISLDKGYNLKSGGENNLFSEEVKQKISKAHRGKSLSDEHKMRLSEARKGKTLSDEHKRKIGEANKGKIRSKEVCAKNAQARIGTKHTEETKEKMRVAQASRKKMCLSI